MSIIINIKEYEILKELGKGGYGRVIQVKSKPDNKYFAIKEIPIKQESNQKLKYVQNEFDILLEFNCDNIVKYYDSDEDENNLYILMEYCDSSTLKDFLEKNVKNNSLIEENILKNIIKQICYVIKEIHDKKIIHRNLKPENIFINEKMEIKIGDFVISKKLHLYKTNILIDNRADSDYYLAPETIDDNIYNEKSDIWSLGCIIYELFNLSIYFKDFFSRKIKKIDSKKYNNKWQKLIDSLLQVDSSKRFDIEQVIKFLENELKIYIEPKDSIDKEKNKLNNINNKENKIVGEIYIKKYDVNKDIQIINSFENKERLSSFKNDKSASKYNNEREIKNSIKIIINGKAIDFTYFYKFDEEGKYKIEYLFKYKLTNTSHMFYQCNSITNLDLSNFDTRHVTDMSFMFSSCRSLTNINLSNINTKRVTSMMNMFASCISLKNLDLSSFNTKNVTFMHGMFSRCKSLSNLDLSNFNTKSVIIMTTMFQNCESLSNLNLSNFNTQKVANMKDIFYGCESLKKENIITKDDKIIKAFINKQ